MVKLKYFILILPMLLFGGCFMDTQIGLIPIEDKDTHLDTTFYLNQSWIASPVANRTSPDVVTDKVALFARDDGDLYIKRPNGNVRRITTANSGSYIWDEEMIINNHTTFKGNVVLDNTVYNGGSVGYACIDGDGRLFKSTDPCDTTSDTWTNSTIANATLGVEN